MMGSAVSTQRIGVTTEQRDRLHGTLLYILFVDTDTIIYRDTRACRSSILLLLLCKITVCPITIE